MKRDHSPLKRTHSKRRSGYTLIELLVATSVSSMLIVGLPSSIYIVSQSVSGDNITVSRSNTAEIQSQFMNDLKHAVSFGELTSTAITMTIPDRDNDGRTEVIRYSWTGVAGDPLLYQYNSEAEVTLVDDIHQFDLTSITRSISAPIIPEPDVILDDDNLVFGNDTQYSETDTGLNLFAIVTKAVLVQDGYLQSITAYLDTGNDGDDYYLGIYSDNNGQPKTLLAISDAGTESGEGWKTLSVSETKLTAGTYWLAIGLKGSQQKIFYPKGVTFYSDGSGDTKSTSIDKKTTIPNSWPGTKYSSSATISIYGTYSTKSLSGKSDSGGSDWSKFF